jgi:uncharacterized protein (UPF0333 family)
MFALDSYNKCFYTWHKELLFNSEKRRADTEENNRCSFKVRATYVNKRYRAKDQPRMAFCPGALPKAAAGRQDKRIQSWQYEPVGDKEMNIKDVVNGFLKKSLKKIKAQVSMEYMILVGFLVVITIPLILVYNTQYRGTSQQIISNQADQIGQKIADTAESIYYLGQPSKTTLKIYMPQQINQTLIMNNSIVFYILWKGGTSEVVKVSDVPVQGSISSSSGIHYITLQSVGSYVNISST